jgi:hypothetical protein
VTAAVEGVLLAIGAACLLVLGRTILARLGRAGPSPLDRRRRTPPAAGHRPEALLILERAVRFSETSSADMHVRLRPVLREVARERLLAHGGIDLDREPDAARAALGETAWELVRPDRPAPPSARDPAASPALVRSIVDAVERV